MNLFTEKKWHYKSLYFLWGITISLILVLIAFSDGITYAWDRELNDIPLAFFGIIILLCIHAIFRNIKDPFNIRVIALVGFVFFIFQVFALKYYYFKTGWDAGAIIAAAFNVAQGKPVVTNYFSMYPNNIFLPYLFSRILKVCFMIGISQHGSYIILMIFQCVISYVAGILTFYVSYKLSRSSIISVIVYVLYLLLIGLSPWVSIPYSDSTGLIFPVAILAMYFSENRKTLHSVLKWIIMGFLAYIGYKIKPTIFIVFIAIFMLEIPNLFSADSRRRTIWFISMSVLGIFLGCGIARMAYLDFDRDINPESRFGAMHFFAMGLNENAMGGWAGGDVGYSGSFETRKERDAADWRLAKERIEDMGVSGVAKQYARKLLTTFNDGSFAWTLEGEFFEEVYEKNDIISQSIRSFVYENGSRYKLFIKFEQMIWLSVLCMSLIPAFGSRNKEYAVIMLALLGFILYSMLFEVRARYLYIFAPLFLILAGSGMMQLEYILNKVLKLKKQSS